MEWKAQNWEAVMAKRTRDVTARSRIRAHLVEHGPVHDERGGATTMLREAIDYQGSPVAFIQLITSMDEAGEITREIRGKRTYGISVAHGVDAGVPVSATVPSPAPQKIAEGSIDYDELARALLRELGRALVSAQSSQAEATVAAVSGPEAADRTRELVVERDRLQAERDDYAVRLESSRKQLNALFALYVGEGGGDAALSTDETVQQAFAQLRSATTPPAAERAS